MSEPSGDTEGSWTEDFFAGAWLQVQRTIHPPETSAEQAEDLADLLDLAEGDRVLDAPCGEGRISLALGALGIETVGVDKSLPLLEDARRAAAERELPATFVELDLRQVDRLLDAGALVGTGEGQPFDAAVCIWGSFGYFGDGGVHGAQEGGGDLAFARAVASVLTPGGSFVIDVPGIEMLMARYNSRGWFDAGGVRVLEQRAFDPVEGVMHVEWTLIHGGSGPEGAGPAQVDVRHSRMRIYSAAELARLLARAGFRGFELYSDLGGSPWAPGDRMVLVATR